MSRSSTNAGRICLFALLLLGCKDDPWPGPVYGWDDAGYPDRPNLPRSMVVVVSLDGCRPDALTEDVAPVLTKLASEGAIATSALTIPLSYTLPSHTSMLSGYDLEHHKIDWDYADPTRETLHVPTVFHAATAVGLRAAIVVGKDKLLMLAQPRGRVGAHLAYAEDAIESKASAIAASGSHDLMFVHFPEPDLTGHSTGWMSPAYLARLTVIDAAVGRLLAALPSGSTIIVTADHGGNGYSHGTTDLLDRKIPWIIRGPGVRAGTRITRSITTMDTAATVLHVLGLRQDPAAQGRPVLEAFQVIRDAGVDVVDAPVDDVPMDGPVDAPEVDAVTD